MSTSTNHSEITAVLDYMEKEKGISRAIMTQVITSSIEHAAEKSITAGQKVEVTIEPKTNKLTAHVLLRVVDSVSDPVREVHISDAPKFVKPEDPAPKLGDVVRKSLNPAELGRIVAQATKQAIMQSVRQFEKEHILDEFKGRIGTIVNGVVRRRERGEIIVELGKAEASLPSFERTLRDDFNVGDRVRCLLKNIENKTSGPEIILSRRDPNFIKRLLELEAAEIGDGTVTVAAYAREPGHRTKIAVASSDPKVDPVGACVGARGVRIRNIVKELNDEKVDVLRWYEDPVQMLVEAIKPAKPLNVRRDDNLRQISFDVAEPELKIVIGHKGMNAKLTSRLIGWRLDIHKEERRVISFKAKTEKAVTSWSTVPGITPELAERLVPAGFPDISAFEGDNGATAEDLIEAGFEPSEAARIVDLVMEAKAAKAAKLQSQKPKASEEITTSGSGNADV
jgi:N utilization substance protein A